MINVVLGHGQFSKSAGCDVVLVVAVFEDQWRPEGGSRGQLTTLRRYSPHLQQVVLTPLTYCQHQHCHHY